MCLSHGLCMPTPSQGYNMPDTQLSGSQKAKLVLALQKDFSSPEDECARPGILQSVHWDSLTAFQKIPEAE